MRKATLVLPAVMAAVTLACGTESPTAPSVTEVIETPAFNGMPAGPMPNLITAPGEVMRTAMGPDALMPNAGMSNGDYVIDLSVNDDQARQFGLGVDILVGERRQLRTQHGGVDRTAATTWTSNDISIADFPDPNNAPGSIRGVSAGTAWVTARWGRYFRTLRVVVTAPGGDSGGGGGGDQPPRSPTPPRSADYEIVNVARYVPILGDVADWLLFTWRANVSAQRFQLSVRFQQGKFHSECTETWRSPVAGAQERETTIPSICGVDQQWQSVTISPADGRNCSGCGTFARASLPETRLLAADSADPHEVNAIIDEVTLRAQTAASSR